MADPRWRIQDGGSKMADPRLSHPKDLELKQHQRVGLKATYRSMADPRWRIQDGGSKMADPRWRIQDGGSKMAAKPRF